MELRHLYTLSELIHEKIEKDELPYDILEKMEIKMLFRPVTFYGIDKEFYYMTHNNSYDGFVHSEVVNATINGIRFKIMSEVEEKVDDKTEII